jgi:hypothetical protein
MQMTYRVTKWNTPDADETLVGSPEEARRLIAELDRKLAGKLRGHDRATYLSARATLYEALGDRAMLDAAKAAWAFSKTANTAALVAVALHHYGRLKEANEWYQKAYKLPHEAGFEIDIGASNAMLCEGNWLKAWPIIRKLKKRMVYAGYMKEWDGKPCKELQVVSEGGIGDLIQNSRFLPLLGNMGVDKVVVYLPPFFFKNGFVELAKAQSWFPEIRVMTEAKQNIPSVGFFDLPAVFGVTEGYLPPAPIWQANPILEMKYSDIQLDRPGRLKENHLRPSVGFCWRAEMSETPLCPPDVYRSLSDKNADKIIKAGDYNWVSLQYGIKNLFGITEFDIKTLEDTAAIISNLDAVITVDTVILHLAASLSKPTYVLLSGASDWKFGMQGDRCIWYPSVRLFRNEGFGFDNAVEKILVAINDKLIK